METLAALLGGPRVEHECQPPAVIARIPETREEADGECLAPVRSRLAANPRLRPAIRKFATRLDKQLTAFEHAYTARNFEELAQLAHWLKGAAGTVGYDEFRPCIRVEMLRQRAAPT